ncbi:MAG: tRNA 2-thiouridine(34) synthase MnmA [Actinomycetes bacterium]
MKVLVAMSGGVDSSVAAALLRDAGHEVTGVTLKLWGGDSDSGCCSVADVEDARRVAQQLDLPHYVFNLTEEFDARVVDPYVAAHAAGRTPNPCVECNRSVKWGLLLDRCRTLGFDALATGHHARIARDGAGRAWIERGADPAKDQSYVLAVLDGAAVADTLLPVGELTKADVRARAEALGLRTATKAESMDVCFIRRGARAEFLRTRLPAAPGPVVDLDGTPVGEHEDLAGFTIGQRRGTGVAAGERRYVVDLDVATATVVLGRREDLLRDRLELSGFTPTHGSIADGTEVLVQTSAHGAPVPGVLDGSTLRLGEARPRVAPGQVVALYVGDRVVAGAYAA